jgi:CBS domain containing-hemolysin-like protein
MRYLFQALGIRASENVKPGVSVLLFAFYILMYPLFWIFSTLNLAIVGEKTEEDSRDEIESVVESAYSEQALEADEYKILKNTMQFNEMTVHEVMTPRTVIFGMSIMSTIADVVDNPELQNYSRIPVWEGESIDDGVRGYVLTKDVFYAAVHEKGESTLEDFVREIRIINESDTLDDVLERILGSRNHIFMVADEYGGITGLITLEDVLETIIGEEILDEGDEYVDMRQLAKQLRDKKITKL